MLDGYGRADFLQQEFGLDNSEFVNFLRQRDFVVADRSVANYPFTVPSIGSTLNFSYLEELVREDLEASQFRRYMRGLLRNNRVVRLLRGAGYSIVTIPSEYHEAHLTGADIEMSEWWHPNMFDMAILDMTPLPWLMRQAGWEVLCEIHRARILDSFEKVKQAVGLPERKFVYSHIFVGHPPFVFGDHNARANRCDTWSDGEGFFAATGMSRQEYIEGYRAQVEYLNREVKALVDSILERSSRHPVVIIQGDHGPGSRVSFTTLEGTDVEERFSILNAYHLPGVDRELLYDTITPVNTFRVVLNEYFGTSYPMLEDKSYYYSLGRPHDFVPVESQESVVGRNLGCLAGTRTLCVSSLTKLLCLRARSILGPGLTLSVSFYGCLRVLRAN